MIDVLFIAPNNSAEIYQELATAYSAVEPPTWALLLAQSARSKGFTVSILDTCAENITDEEAISRVKRLEPRLTCFVVYGQNVNAGVVSMSGATRLSRRIKESGSPTVISMVGTYTQALPLKTIKDELSIDFVFTNEGVRALWNVLALPDITSFANIKGIAFRKDGVPTLNQPELVVQNLDVDLPGYAWDLLPFRNTFLDLYRSPMWHALYQDQYRSPYAAIQTSLGCQFGCEFCVINMINRDDTAEVGIAGNYSKMRHWSPEFVIKQVEYLASRGVYTIKITDELFLLNKKYYVPFCEALRDGGHGKQLKLWVYSRVDTVSSPETLTLLRDAGVKWIALGIESSSQDIRLEVSKGRFKDVKIKEVVNQIHTAGIEVMANYIFGLPGDTQQTMQETLDLSLDLCTSGWNGYAAMTLPGSQLYYNAVKNGHRVPTTYTEYSFHGHDTICAQTESLTPSQILNFRDNAFTIYHTNSSFLSRICEKYGSVASNNIQQMTKIKLTRKLFSV